MKNGIALFRYAGVDAVRKKLGQLRDLEVIASMDATKMSGNDKRAALNDLIFPQ